MFKYNIFRLGNILLLGFITLMGAVFFQSNGAHGDAYGTNCPPDWSYVSGFCFTGTYMKDTGTTTCASAYGGRQCCTYEGFKVFCTTTQVGYSYALKYAGQYGTCDPNTSHCVVT